jgi:hypothetical protein
MSGVSFLAPDTLFGNFTVTEVRAIDVSWNLAMGRVLPFGMAVVFFKVASIALLRIAEGTGVTYDLFATVTLNLHAWQAALPLAKATLRTAGWKAKAAMAFMLYSALLILAMPTLMDLQTGYVRRQALGYRFGNGTIVGAETVSCQKGSKWDGSNRLATNCMLDGVMLGSVCMDGDAYQWGWSFVWFSLTHFLTGFWAAGS